MTPKNRISFELAKLLKDKGFPQSTEENGFVCPKYSPDGDFINDAKWADDHPKTDFKEIYDWLNTYTNMTFDQLDAFEKEFGPSKPFTCDDCDKIHCSRSQYVMSNCSNLEN